MAEEKSLSPVVEYLEEIGGEDISTGLTPQKIWDRAILIDDPERPDCIVFEVERHHPILGTTYSPGSPMAAFETCWPIYSFNSKTKTIEVVGENRPAEVDIDHSWVADSWVGDVSFDFSPAKNGQHICREMQSGEESLVRNIKEVEEFAKSIVNGWSLDCYEDELDEHLEPKEIQEHMENIKNICKEIIVDRAKEAWEEYLEEIKNGEEEIS
jgi:hypothetical protein